MAALVHQGTVVLSAYRKLNDLLSGPERRRAKLVFALMVTMALFEVAGAASIMPFVALLANPEMVHASRQLSALYRTLGFEDPQRFLFFIGLVVLGLFIAALAIKALTSYAITRFSYMRMHTISCRLLGAYLRQPYTFFLGRNTADLGHIVLSEVQTVTKGVLVPGLRVLSGSLVAAALLALLVIVEPKLSLSVAGILGGSFTVIYLLVRPLLARIGARRVQDNQQRFVLANEALNGIKELRLLGREDAYLERFTRPSEQYARHLSTHIVISHLPHFGIQAVAFGGVQVMVLYLMTRPGGLAGALPLIALYAFVGYRLLPAFQEIFENLTTLRFSIPALDALHSDVFAKESGAIPVAPPAQQPRVNGSIRLDNATYWYPGAARPSLENLALEIPAGVSLGIVGETGAGKSTLIDLILGLIQPTSGHVTVGGEPISGARLRSWQNNVGYVPQSPYLADDTVAANIAFGVPLSAIDVAAVERAAQAAHIHDFIVEQLPHGYDTVVGERGIRLSGGQRQRIAIARALYHDPEVVVFDEATSALDNTTESAVMDAIHELHGRKTILLVAHRLSTVRDCDRICVLHEGRLQSTGSYAELLENSLPFRAMVQGAHI